MMSSDLLKHAAEIVEAYVSNNEIQARELPGLLKEVFGTLMALSVGTSGEGIRKDLLVSEDIAETMEATEAEEIKSVSRIEKKKIVPFLPVNQAVTHEAILCLICGKSCKALKGHLTRSHKIDCDQYRTMFDLDKTFPLVAPAYSEHRRALALEFGLGDKLRESRKQARQSDE
ncbi:MAG: MucR family transcriptional regulator [Magnetococcus sp. YQC-5]